MNWFWGSDAKAGKPEDPYKNLDPSLRNFLDKESATKNGGHQGTPAAAPPPTPSTPDARGPSTNYRAQLGLDAPGLDPQNQTSPRPSSTASVPAESLFPDGRYAHLWQTYRSSAELSQQARSDQDRLAEVAETMRDRKAAIARAAVENCVLEQLAERECWTSGSVRDTMTMCREQNRAFTRCYTMQARFLKALGYLSSAHGGPEGEERIQMHADKLYHEMLARERVQEEARREGREVPTFAPLIQHEKIEAALGPDSAWSWARRRAQEMGMATTFSALPQAKQKEIGERIKAMGEQEREVELQLIVAEERAKFEYAEEYAAAMERERLQRADRRERGKETIGDTLKRLWGWSQ